MALQGLILFPGITRPLSGSFTLSHGISPSVCHLEFAPQSLPTIDGTLQIRYGPHVMLFPAARIDQASVRLTSEGLVCGCSIFDRRWRWRFGNLSGSYNVRLADGRLDRSTLARPRTLAALCLSTMGETGFDVSQLPNDAYPEVHWHNETPAQALDSLVNDLGCRIVLTLANTVRIVRVGVGASLPPGGKLEDAAAVDPPERPDSLLVVGAPSVFEVEFELEAVGREPNSPFSGEGAIKPIDQLSYRPANGWLTETTSYFNVLDQHGRDAYEAARATVRRWYRITDRDPRTPALKVLVPGLGRLQSLAQVLPIPGPYLGRTPTPDVAANAEGVAAIGDPTVAGKPRPAEVHGEFWDGKVTFGTTDPGTSYTKPFAIDLDRGIVQFNEYVCQIKNAFSGRQIQPAVLTLTIGVHVRDLQTRAFHRFTQARVFQGAAQGTGPRVLKHDELALTYAANRNDAGNIVSVETNLPELQEQANYYIVAAALEYQVEAAQDTTYIGLIPVNPDGAIQQVTWTFGDAGATTRASRNTEWNPAVPSYAERRQALTVRREVVQQMRERNAKAVSRRPRFIQL